ncbi:MAG: rhamnosyltransferase [Oleiphilaceae bacterium]|jgi:rhamnosyltransferase
MAVTPLPRIAVLMAVYDGMRWIATQIDSILTQELVDITLYISVDLSNDDSANWCQELANTDTRIVLLPLGERYGSATRNFFRLLQEVDFSTFQYVSLADQDDIWHPDKLHRAIKTLKAEGANGYSSNVTAWWEDKRQKQRLLDKAQPMKKLDYVFESGGPGCTYVMSLSLAIGIQQCLLQTPTLIKQLNFHDWFCYAYARALDIPWYIDRTPTMLYRQHSDNAVGINRGLHPFIKRAKHVLSGQAFEQSRLTLQVVFNDMPQSIPLTLPNNRWQFFKLALKTRQCRRRPRDQFYFFCLCLMITIYGYRKHKN